jgi:hypothetical protein
MSAAFVIAPLPENTLKHETCQLGDRSHRLVLLESFLSADFVHNPWLFLHA